MRAKLSTLLRLTPAALVAVLGGSAPAAADEYFLKVDGTQGESMDAKHKGEIVIESFQWGVSNAGGGRVGEPGKATFQDFAITARMSKASPNLFLSCARGESLKYAILTVRRAGKEQQEYYTIKMEDVRVSSIQNGSPSASTPVGDTVTFNFSKITWSYVPQKADGSLDGAVVRTWDLRRNEGS